jgi:hypothetical protein
MLPPMMILRLTPTAAFPEGETAGEWQLLEQQVRVGRWTTGPRTDAERLRALATELGVALREEDVVPSQHSRSQTPHQTG